MTASSSESAQDREPEGSGAGDRRDAFMQSLAEGLAHELKNPLSILRMNIQLLREDFKEDDTVIGRRVAKRAEILEIQSRRLQETIDEFLRFAQGQALQLRQCNINNLLRELLDFIAGELPKSRIRLLTNLQHDLSPVVGDPEVLKQAFLNILINAQQAMSDGGELLVSALNDTDSVIIHITDTGVGIPPENMEKIFHVYFSTKKGGTGLGLPTARRIIKQHGGALDLHSVLGKGTSFCVRLPLSGPRRHNPSEGEVDHAR